MAFEREYTCTCTRAHTIHRAGSIEKLSDCSAHELVKCGEMDENVNEMFHIGVRYNARGKNLFDASHFLYVNCFNGNRVENAKKKNWGGERGRRGDRK